MAAPGPYDMALETACEKFSDQAENCRLFFRSISPLPDNIVFGLDPESMSPFEDFKEQHSGLILEKEKDLNLHIGNSTTGARSSVIIEPRSVWPSLDHSLSVRVRLISLDISKAINSVTGPVLKGAGAKTIEGAWSKPR
jgi:hypothetical protein